MDALVGLSTRAFTIADRARGLMTTAVAHWSRWKSEIGQHENMLGYLDRPKQVDTSLAHLYSLTTSMLEMGQGCEDDEIHASFIIMVS